MFTSITRNSKLSTVELSLVYLKACPTPHSPGGFHEALSPSPRGGRAKSRQKSLRTYIFRVCDFLFKRDA